MIVDEEELTFGCGEGGRLIGCTFCFNSAHAECCGLGDQRTNAPRGDWACPACIDHARDQLKSDSDDGESESGGGEDVSEEEKSDDSEDDDSEEDSEDDSEDDDSEDDSDSEDEDSEESDDDEGPPSFEQAGSLFADFLLDLVFLRLVELHVRSP